MISRHVALAALVLFAGLVPAAASASGQAASTSNQAYNGTHLTFEHNGSAVVDYALDGETIATSMEVQSASQLDGSLDLGMEGNRSAVTAFEGADLSMTARGEAATTIRTSSGATIRAHDNTHGSLVVDANQSQYVALDLAADSDVRAESDQRAVVETDGNVSAAVLVVGEGNVTVDEEGNLVAEVTADSKFVVRSYPEGRSEADARDEQLIVNGTAAAEVYVDQQSGERVSGSVVYDASTSVTVDAESEQSVNVTVDRSAHEGKVVIASASSIEAESSEAVSVQVDGETAGRASSYSELRAAAHGGSTSKYMVRNTASAEADAEVLVAVNHFSERTVTISETEQSGDDGTDSDGTATVDETTESDGDSESSDQTTASGNGPGFGVLASLVALAGLSGCTALDRR